jgi:hypothetical protein
MSPATIPRKLRGWLTTLGERCEYCRTSEWVTGIPLEVDHIRPRSQGGETSESNLCRACSTCNTNKGDRTWAVDPTTGQRTSLFNPRQQQWAEHFAWNADGTQIMGLTTCGRATVEALSLNNPRIVRARRLWVTAGWHPPVE